MKIVWTKRRFRWSVRGIQCILNVEVPGLRPCASQAPPSQGSMTSFGRDFVALMPVFCKLIIRGEVTYAKAPR